MSEGVQSGVISVNPDEDDFCQLIYSFERSLYNNRKTNLNGCGGWMTELLIFREGKLYLETQKWLTHNTLSLPFPPLVPWNTKGVPWLAPGWKIIITPFYWRKRFSQRDTNCSSFRALILRRKSEEHFAASLSKKMLKFTVARISKLLK